MWKTLKTWKITPGNISKIIIAIGILVVAGMVVLVATVLGSTDKATIKDLQKTIAIQDSIIKANKGHIDANNKRYDEIKSEVTVLEVKYQRVQAELDKIEDKLTANKTRYDKIPSTVRNMSKDSLRRAVTGFKPE